MPLSLLLEKRHRKPGNDFPRSADGSRHLGWGVSLLSLPKEKIMTRDDELWIAAKEAACHFWDPANDGKAGTCDRVKAIGFMIAFLARWHVPENGCGAFCDDIATAAKAALADFAKEDAAVEAASTPAADFVLRAPGAPGNSR